MTTDNSWDAATFDGARRAQMAAIAQTTPTQRMEWLEQALNLALLSGAVERDRTRRQMDIDAAWA